MPKDWVRLTTVPNAVMAESWVQLLIDSGIAAAAPEAKMPYYLAQTVFPVRILVPEEQLERAKVVLEELVGPLEER
jgi:hypothetical protein